MGYKLENLQYSMRIDMFKEIRPLNNGPSPVLIFREQKVEQLHSITERNVLYDDLMMIELTTLKRLNNRDSINLQFVASNLSISVLFLEDTLVKGGLEMHLLETDMWIYEVMVYAFAAVILGFIFSLVTILCVMSCIRCILVRTGRDVPRCLKKYLKPILRDYKFLVNNKSITEKKFGSASVCYNQDKCPICLEPFGAEEKVSILKCHHVFHCFCVTEWVNRMTEKSQLCPVCNHEIRKTGPARPVPAQQEEFENELPEISLDNPEENTLRSSTETLQAMQSPDESSANIVSTEDSAPERKD